LFFGTQLREQPDDLRRCHRDPVDVLQLHHLDSCGAVLSRTATTGSACPRDPCQG
jgi:hypothetical protein